LSGRQEATQPGVAPIGKGIICIYDPNDLKTCFGECAGETVGEALIAFAAEPPCGIDDQEASRM
jgi:hypothetical protein